MKPWGMAENQFTAYYKFPGDSAGHIDGDGTLGAGAGHMTMSAKELARICSALEHGKLLSPAMYKAQRDNQLGMFKDGGFFTHNGGQNFSGGRGLVTRFAICPGDVQVAIVVNSKGNTCDSLLDIIKSAYAAAQQ
jgi:hypothetical protein